MRVIAPLAMACALVVGCGGATFANGVYDDGTVRYRVGDRAGDWERVEVEDNDLAFHHVQLGTISVNSTCEDYEDVPDIALLNHLLFGTSERRFRIEETVTVDGRGARHVVVDLELDGVPLTLEIYLLKKDGCVYDLVYTARRDIHEHGAPLFHALVQGFAVLDTRL